jgi:hypothetical protein
MMARSRLLGVVDFLPVAAGCAVFAAGLGVLWWIKRLAVG